MMIVELLAATAFGGPGGRVLVDNDAGIAVTLQVEGRESLVVRADEQVVLWLPYGQTSIRATYEQFGRARTLEVETVDVVPRDTAYVHLGAERRTRLRVANETRLAGDLYVNGQLTAHLEPGEREIVRVDVGASDLELRDARGRVLEHDRLALRAYADNVWTVDLPRTARVLVSNDHGIPVTVEVDGRYVASVGPWDDASVEVPVGLHRFEVFDARGRLVDSRTMDVDPWEQARIEVDGPSHPSGHGGHGGRDVHERDAVAAHWHPRR